MTRIESLAFAHSFYLRILDIGPDNCEPNRPIDRVWVKQLKRDIKTNGQNEPIKVRWLDADTVQIIDGFHRLIAMRELGLEFIRCVVADDLTESARQGAKGE